MMLIIVLYNDLFILKLYSLILCVRLIIILLDI